MKILCIKSCMASGVALEVGKTYDVTNKDGDTLIKMGKAERASEQEAPKPKPKRKPKADGV
jgi:hypothetical protein